MKAAAPAAGAAAAPATAVPPAVEERAPFLKMLPEFKLFDLSRCLLYGFWLPSDLRCGPAARRELHALRSSFLSGSSLLSRAGFP
jgi:hypothetical protein